jgi:putative holliday junction resolvase
VTEHDNVQGPILCLDLGRKRIGAAVADPTFVAITPLKGLRRSNWKQLLRDVGDLVLRFDAKTLVLGFPLNLDGSEGSAAKEARELAKKFARSLHLPVYLQDERLTSVEAEERLRAQGYAANERVARLDSESAAIILRDFIADGQQRMELLRPFE